MSEGSLISPNNESLSTPKESIKTPKFREFHEMSGCLAALKSPRDLDSINTPLLLPTPIPNTSEGLLSTPTLGTPRTADPWNGLFSPLALASNSALTIRNGRVGTRIVGESVIYFWQDGPKFFYGTTIPSRLRILSEQINWKLT